MQHLSDKKAEYQACINEIQQKTKSEQQEIEKIIEQLKLLEQDYTEAQADAKYLTKDINVLIEAKIRQDGTIAQLKKANIEMVTQIQNLEIKNEDITRKLQTGCNKNKISRNTIRALRNKLALAEQETQSIGNELSKQISNLQAENDNLKATSIRINYEISNLLAEKERNETDIIMLTNELRIKKELIKMFKKDIDAVAELKNDNDRLRHTDTTLFRISCCAVILFVIVCLGWQLVATYEI